MRGLALAIVVLALATGPARAQVLGEPAGYSHDGQFGLAVRISSGFRLLATYDEERYCGEIDGAGLARVCTGRSPVVLDVELGYGAGPAVDAILEMRIGLERDFAAGPGGPDGPRAFHFAPGVRVFFSESSRAKLFMTAQAVLDLTGHQDAGGDELGIDFGVRNMSGLWIDLARSYGVFVYIGETVTFSRWLRFEAEAGFGIQGRYP